MLKEGNGQKKFKNYSKKINEKVSEDKDDELKELFKMSQEIDKMIKDKISKKDNE